MQEFKTRHAPQDAYMNYRWKFPNVPPPHPHPHSPLSLGHRAHCHMAQYHAAVFVYTVARYNGDALDPKHCIRDGSLYDL